MQNKSCELCICNNSNPIIFNFQQFLTNIKNFFFLFQLDFLPIILYQTSINHRYGMNGER
jgi:hypothetical protein